MKCKLKLTLALVCLAVLALCLVACSGAQSGTKCRHQFSGWSLVKEPSITEEGLQMRICELCNEEEFRWLDKISNEENISEGLAYTLSPDGGTYYIVSGIGTCKDTDIVIPAIYEGKLVKEIGERAFVDCSSLTSVVISKSVTSIGPYAFTYCDNLASVTIPDSVTSIGDVAFAMCPALTTITVAEGNTTYQSIDGNLYTIDGKTLIQYAIGKTDTSFTIPDSVTGIGSGAFAGCSSLTSVTIGNSVTSIGVQAFYMCSALTSVVIPKSVTSIGESAFDDCSSLTSVVIPDSVTSIGVYAFAMCPALTTITVAEGNTIYQSIDGNLYTIDGKTLIQYAIGKTDTSFTIPDSVTSIGNSAFAYCSRLTSVTIPDSVTSIEYGAFYGCSNLTSVTIGNSVTSIGDFAFEGCASLTSVVIPKSVTNIEAYAFRYCDLLAHIYYDGTETEWQQISIADGNDNLSSATIHYAVIPVPPSR